MNPFIGEIILFGGNFAPRGWALCHGQLLAIASNTALFSILGTTYGGDGRTTFGLPDLRGRAVVGQGRGPGLSTYTLGEKTGTETNHLTISNLPSHSHGAQIPISTEGAGETEGFLASSNSFAEEATTGANYPGITTSNTGGNASVNNVAPFLTTNYIIAIQGVYPSRS